MRFAMLVCAAWVSAALAGADGDWPQWRGPTLDGVSQCTGLPTSGTFDRLETGPTRFGRGGVSAGFSAGVGGPFSPVVATQRSRAVPGPEDRRGDTPALLVRRSRGATLVRESVLGPTPAGIPSRNTSQDRNPAVSACEIGISHERQHLAG